MYNDRYDILIFDYIKIALHLIGIYVSEYLMIITTFVSSEKYIYIYYLVDMIYIICLSVPYIIFLLLNL